MSMKESAEPPRAGVSPPAGTSHTAGEPAHPGVALGVERTRSEKKSSCDARNYYF